MRLGAALAACFWWYPVQRFFSAPAALKVRLPERVGALPAIATLPLSPSALRISAGVDLSELSLVAHEGGLKN